jgi:very-short-patch-repair endonuclease
MKVIVEVDGISHDNREIYDQKRTETMKTYGYRVIRFSNDDMLSNVYGVLESIERFLCDAQPTLNPSLKGGDKI